MRVMDTAINILQNTNRKSYVMCLTVIMLMTLSYLWRLF